MSEAYKKLIKTLQTIFEMDKADLDFGIYRIMNQKREEINRFLEHDLLPQVKEAFADYAKGGRSEVQAELEQLIKTLTEAGMDPEQSPKVKELREKTRGSVDMAALENEVYSHLHTFFSRYYDKGDFISQRRYKKDTYAIPYEGEEVKLYWANQDQYYIKSSEHLRNYAFIACDESGKTVRIKLVEADTEKDNVKVESGKERRFVLDADNPLSVENGELHIHFHYIPAGKKKQDALNKEAVDTILNQKGFEEWMPLLKQKAPTEKNPDRSLLEKHLNEYTARNTFDYFIHKDLGGFLRRELDFYIKNEVLYLDDIDDAAFTVTEQHLRKIKVIRTIAHKIIRLLAQLEDFQKKLWLKKKFVVETNYCITLDRVPEELYPQIADNQAQHQEWVKLGFIENDTIINTTYLKENPFLVLDTRFFDNRFKDKLLASIEDFDEQCDGLLIHSENFQALNLLQDRYREQVKFMYIDPPYNKGYDGFIYKDKYQSSTWLSMIYDRLTLKDIYLTDSGVLSVSIDDDEDSRLIAVLDSLFGRENFIGHIIWDRNHSAQAGYYKIYHEYICNYAKSKSNLSISLSGEGVVEAGAMKKPSKRHKLQEFTFPAGTKIEAKDGTEFTGRWGGAEFVELVSGRMVAENGRLKYPVTLRAAWTQYGQMTKFFKGEEVTDTKGQKVIEFFFTSTGKLKYRKERRFEVPSSVQRFGTASQSTNALAEIIGFELNQTPKPVQLNEFFTKYYCDDDDLIFDYFAGSGTTGHAVINLNREDGGKRKYILVEMGDYFDTVLKPRIAKVAYSKDWKDGKPTAPETGISHCFKYIRLESYEDALNNLILKPRTEQQEDLLEQHADLREDYMLGYWLELETEGSPSLLNIDQFENPFDYKLNIATGSVGATKPTCVDLVETFNYLIGLTVKHIDTIRGFKVITGTNPKEESVLVIWRNLKEKDNAALEAFMDKSGYNPRDTEYEHIYVNGDHTLEDPHSKVKMIEMEFKRLMFDVQDV